MPAQAPLTAAISGFGMVRLLYIGTRAWRLRDWPGCAFCSRRWTSMPGQKALPAPVMITTRTAGSAAASSRSAKKRRSMGMLHAFLRSGRLRVTVATPSSSTSYSTRSSWVSRADSSVIASLLRQRFDGVDGVDMGDRIADARSLPEMVTTTCPRAQMRPSVITSTSAKCSRRPRRTQRA